MCRITIFAGHYGSGKTTAAVAFAKKIKATRNEQPVTIVDIDLVNPYYTTDNAKESLEKLGIKVISPAFANTNVEAPSLPPQIMSAFDDKKSKIIFDVGGDDDGGIVLGRYFVQFSQEKHEFILVINTKRPLTNDAKSIIMYKNDIERVSRLKFTGIANCTNLAIDTSINDILESEKIIMEVEKLTGLEKKYNFVLPELFNDLPLDIKKKAISVEFFNIKPWDYK
jgi:hypothetical protein